MKEFSKKYLKKGLLCNFKEKLCKSDMSKEIFSNNKNILIDIAEEKDFIAKESTSKKEENFFSIGSYFSQVIEIYDSETSKMKLFNLKKLENDGSENIFYYNEQSIYYVHYEISKLFFFNVSSKNSLRNYEFDFSSDKIVNSTLLGKEIPFYFPKNENNKDDYDISYLKDFSICATNDTIYIIYGLKVKKDRKNELFLDLLAYSIEKKQWKTVKVADTSLSLDKSIPRIRASCIAMQKNINDEAIDYIFIFGGTNFLGKTENGPDFLNDIEIYKIKSDLKEADFNRVPKGKYKDTYKPLENSLIIPSVSKSSSEFFMALVGGSYSPFLYSQNNTLSGYYVKILVDPDLKSLSAEFTKFAKNQKSLLKIEYEKLEGLNTIFSSQSRNIYNKKKIFICPNILSQEKKGIYLDLSRIIHKTNSFFIDRKLNFIGKSLLKKKQEFEFQKQLQYQIAFKKSPAIELTHQNSLETKFKYFSLGLYEAIMEKIEKDLVLISDDRAEIVFVKYKKNQKNQNNQDELEWVNYLEFSLSDVKNAKNKKGYVYEDYIPSNLKLTNYSKFDNKIYILVNNSKDNNFKRCVYELNLNNVDFTDSKRVELIKVFEDLTAIKGCAILVESLDICYILCGELAYKEKQEIMEIKKNIMINLNTKKIMKTLPDNNQSMISPFVFLQNNHIICVNRFYSNIRNDHIYGEFWKFETSMWVSFKILFKDENGKLYFENEKNLGDLASDVIIEKIHSLGSINNSDFILVFLVEYKNININDSSPKNHKSKNHKRIIYLNIKYLTEQNKNAYAETACSASEKADITEYDDAYYNITDASETSDNNSTINFINSNFQRTSYENLEIKFKKKEVDEITFDLERVDHGENKIEKDEKTRDLESGNPNIKKKNN